VAETEDRARDAKYQWNPNPQGCCGDAHMELASAMEHFELLGFVRERTEHDGIVEILWKNKPADELSERTAELRKLLGECEREMAQWEEFITFYVNKENNAPAGHQDMKADLNRRWLGYKALLSRIREVTNAKP